MSQPTPPPFTNVRFHDAALDDLRLVASRSRIVLVEVLRLLKQVDAGRLKPTPLRSFAKTGDLSDCGKIVVALPGEPEYRIVTIERDGTINIVEVVAVEDRTGDLPYLLTGIRLSRIDDPVRRADANKRIWKLRQQLDAADDSP